MKSQSASSIHGWLTCAAPRRPQAVIGFLFRVHAVPCACSSPASSSKDAIVLVTSRQQFEVGLLNFHSRLTFPPLIFTGEHLDKKHGPEPELERQGFAATRGQHRHTELRFNWFISVQTRVALVGELCGSFVQQRRRRRFDESVWCFKGRRRKQRENFQPENRKKRENLPPRSVFDQDYNLITCEPKRGSHSLRVESKREKKGEVVPLLFETTIRIMSGNLLN